MNRDMRQSTPHDRHRQKPQITRGRCLLLTLTLLGLAFITACAAPGQTRDDSLYQDLGGRPGIETMVDGLLLKISENSRIVELFANTDPDRFHRTLTEQICELSGGPCAYTGDDMITVHTGMNITEAQFNSLVEDLVDVMEDQRIPVRAQNRLLALLAPMRGDIIRR